MAGYLPYGLHTARMFLSTARDDFLSSLPNPWGACPATPGQRTGGGHSVSVTRHATAKCASSSECNRSSSDDHRSSPQSGTTLIDDLPTSFPMSTGCSMSLIKAYLMPSCIILPLSSSTSWYAAPVRADEPVCVTGQKRSSQSFLANDSHPAKTTSVK